MEHSVEHLTLALCFTIWYQNQSQIMNNNKGHEPITIMDIKLVKGFEAISDEEATRILQSISRLAETIYYHYKSPPIQIMEPEYLQAA